MTAAIVVAGIVAYLAVGTLIAVRGYWALDDRIRRRASQYPGWLQPGPDETGLFFLGALWPIGVWVLVAMVSIHGERNRRDHRAELDAEREQLLAEARHELKVGA